MGTELQTRPPAKVAGTLKDLLTRPDVKAAISAVIPRTMTPERLIKVALATVSRTPALAQCDQMSILKSLMVAAELGLDPSGTLGQGYLVPFNNSKTGRKECQFIPGYRGLITLARRSGDVRSIHAEVVYATDSFRLVKGIHPTIDHVPDYDVEAKDADIVGAYAVAEFKDGGTQFEYMPKRALDAIRKRSKASASGPWVTDYAEMARKTVVRRLAKFLPLQVEEPLAKAVEVENRAEAGDALGDVFTTVGELEDATDAADAPSKSDALAKQLGKPEPETTPDPADAQVLGYIDAIAKSTAVSDVAKWRDAVENDPDLAETDRTALLAACDARATAIRGTRGEKSNGNKPKSEMFQ